MTRADARLLLHITVASGQDRALEQTMVQLLALRQFHSHVKPVHLPTCGALVRLYLVPDRLVRFFGVHFPSLKRI